ncbi:MAG: VWA domain-containing protein [Cytophagaceae bacterium]|nr:VWA domain-containing protein [Cytophagaceae bacterium]
MFLDFFLHLRAHKFPATLSEYLTLLEALERGVISQNVDDFYYLSRAVFVKNEAFLDRYDQLFADYFSSVGQLPEELVASVAEDWLKTDFIRQLTEEEKAALTAAGGLDALLDRFRQLLAEQNERHAGGNTWIGTGGTSPFGNAGYNPEGFKLGGQPGSGQRRAVKVWEQRAYQNYDGDVELNTRNLKMALRRLRLLTREGAADELDLDGTIQETSRNGGLLEIKMQPQRRNRVKILLLLDVGGSMDDHVELVSQLFSAARYQFQHLETLYFHNCLYETLWRDATRRHERLSTWEVLHRYNSDWKVILVGDASMAGYEITEPRGSVEHYNEEAGITWLQRLSDHFKNIVWLNPIPPGYWAYTPSIGILRKWSENRMFPLTINGLTMALKSLKNSKIRHEAA